MATIRKRRRSKRDVWLVDYLDGAGVRHRLTAKTREQAEGLLAEKITESRQAQPVDSTDRNITLAEYGARWLAAAASELKPRTVASYDQLFRLHIEPTLGALKLREIQRAHVKNLLTQKRQAELSKNTVRLIRACLSTMLAEALDDGLLKANPAVSASRRRGRNADSITIAERHQAIRPFSEDELAAFLEAAKVDKPKRQFRKAAPHGSDQYALFLTLARTGIRPGEAFALTWEDLDFSRREILIERTLSAGQVGSTKTGRARRVDMSRELTATLAELYKRREQQTLERGWGEVPQTVFVNDRGLALDESRVRKRFARILKTAKLSGHRVYDLRHTFATSLLTRAPITYVAAQLGHAKPTTTLQWYAHWLPRADDKGFVDSLDGPVLPQKTGTDGDGLDSVPFTSAPRHQFGTDLPSEVQSPPAAEVNPSNLKDVFGATRRIRTDDLLITNQLLYQLS
jgi:integrase